MGTIPLNEPGSEDREEEGESSLVADGSALGFVGGGTILATACCSIPIALGVLGLGGFGVAGFVAEYRVWFVVPALIALLAGWGFYLKPRLLGPVSWQHGSTTGILLVVLTFVSGLYLWWFF